MKLITDPEELINSVVKTGGVVLVLGDRGTGKTSLCQKIGDKCAEMGIKFAYIDGNLASYTLSGVGILGLGISDREKDIRKMSPVKEYFVGSMTAKGHGIDIIFGTGRLIKEAKKQGCKVILADTLGEYDYSGSVIFAQNEIEALYPDYIVGIQANHEIEFALCPFTRQEKMNIAILQKDPLAVDKKNLLEFGKKMSFSRLFSKSSSHIVMMSQVTFLNTWLGNGRQLKWQYFRTLSNILKSEVYHVEIAYKTLFVFSDAEADDIMINDIKEFLHVSHVIIQKPNIYSNLYVGLRNGEKEHLGVGLIENIHFGKNVMLIRSNILSFEPVKQIKFGFIKTAATGDFITEI